MRDNDTTTRNTKQESKTMSNAATAIMNAINEAKTQNGDSWAADILKAVTAIQVADICAKRDEEEKATEEPKMDAVEVGDIFSSSWGYDQTNVTFYQVVKVTKKFATIQKINSVTTEKGFMCGTSVPVQPVQLVGETLRRKINDYFAHAYNSGPSLKVESYAFAYRWDGTPQRCSWYA